ncbi:MAG: ATP-binding protein [Chloroflexi bacterium]|nr:ATP-binding protein [Chloroflexota bacterium]
MRHPHTEWTRRRLEDYVGTTETLTLEFKSCRALLGDDKKDKDAKMQEAAKDLAAMANEQGGVIIYGIEETKTGTGRRALRVEEGFPAGGAVSREWFLQFARDRVHPPLHGLEVVEVHLDDQHERFALVVIVPQAVGGARQTDDLLFWRRDAQGLRKMTVQEIEDIRLRGSRPQLVLSAFVLEATNSNNKQLDLKTQFRVHNPSSTTASFAVVTLALTRNTSAASKVVNEWRWLEVSDDWKVTRCVLSSGSSSYWSPITPGFTLVTEALTISTPFYSEIDPVRPRELGLARLDHDGGSDLYTLVLRYQADLASKIRLEPNPEGALPDRLGAAPVPPIICIGPQPH